MNIIFKIHRIAHTEAGATISLLVDASDPDNADAFRSVGSGQISIAGLKTGQVNNLKPGDKLVAALSMKPQQS